MMFGYVLVVCDVSASFFFGRSMQGLFEKCFGEVFFRRSGVGS